MIWKSSKFKGQNEVNIILIITKQVGKVDSPHKEKNTNHILFKKRCYMDYGDKNTCILSYYLICKYKFREILVNCIDIL